MKTLIKTGLAVIALSLCLNANALAGQLEDGFAAVQRGDYMAAYRLWLPLANQGDASAQFNLGLMYNKGQGVPKDYVQAHKWFNLSTANNPEKINREKGVAGRDLVAGKMTPAQIAEAQKLARVWKPISSVPGK